MAKPKVVDRTEMVRSVKLALDILNECMPYDPSECEENIEYTDHWNALRELAFPVILHQVVDFSVE